MKIQEMTRLTINDIFGVEEYSANAPTLASLISSYTISYTIATGSLIESLFSKVLNEYNSYPVFDMEDSTDTTAKNKLIRSWLTKFIDNYEKTKDYYETLINAYTNNKTKLLDDVEATTTNEIFVNDTPQNTGGVFSGTDYTSNYTKTTNTSSSEMATKMTRIKEMQDCIVSMWHKWLEECHCLVLESQGGAFYEQ